MDDLTLTVDGLDYGGWLSVEVARSIEAVAGTFRLGLTERWPGAPARRRIAAGARCSVAIDGETVISGHVDEVQPSFDEGQHGVSVAGRDAAGDLVDCSAIAGSGEWENARLAAIAADICRPFGIAVSAAADTGAAFKSFRIEEGETAWEAIERACRMRTVLAVSDGRGGIVLTRSAAGPAIGTALRDGPKGNMLSAQGRYSDKDRHSRYIVKGQRSGDDYLLPPDIAQPKGEAADPAVTRYRPLIVLAEDQGDGGDFGKRALWEARVRAARARQATIVVQGWRHASGLWAPNTVVRVSSDWLAIEADMTIAGVAFRKDEGGTTSELTLMRPGAFEVQALPEKEDLGW